jgi:hypothetical protein
MSATGSVSVGIPLGAASVRKILMNPVYAGFVYAGGELSPGVHRPIIPKADWDRVADTRERQIASRVALCRREVLDGLMYDSFGRSMTINRVTKRGKTFLHYRSNQNAWGTRHKIKRMRASSDETELLVVKALQELLCGRERFRSLLTELGRSPSEIRTACQKAQIASRRLEALSRDQLRSVLRSIISRIEVSRERIRLLTRAIEFERFAGWDFIGLFGRRMEDAGRALQHLIDIPCAGTVRLERFVRLPITARKSQTYRINKSLRNLMTDARNAWAAVEGNRHVSPQELAQERKMSLSRFMRLIQLNYLAPDIVLAILDGAQPRDLTRRTLMYANLPLDWEMQRRLFGFPEQPPMRTCETPY